MKTAILTILAASLLTGCASIVGSTTQPINVVATRDGRIDRDAICQLTNSRGTWVATGDQVVTVKKGGDLEVKCQGSDSKSAGKSVMETSVQGGYLVANFMFDLCIISCPIDFASGAIYKYPESIRVPMAPTKAN
jgi:hypothetical protein